MILYIYMSPRICVLYVIKPAFTMLERSEKTHMAVT